MSKVEESDVEQTKAKLIARAEFLGTLDEMAPFPGVSEDLIEITTCMGDMMVAYPKEFKSGPGSDLGSVLFDICMLGTILMLTKPGELKDVRALLRELLDETGAVELDEDDPINGNGEALVAQLGGK